MATTAKRPRRKYRYPDRAAAEQAQTDTDQERHQQLRLARALYTGKIEWTQQHGAYRFGVFDQHACMGPRVVQVFAPEAQEPNLLVIDPGGPTLIDIETSALHCNDPESKQILAAVREVRAMLSL